MKDEIIYRYLRERFRGLTKGKVYISSELLKHFNIQTSTEAKTKPPTTLNTNSSYGISPSTTNSSQEASQRP